MRLREKPHGHISPPGSQQHYAGCNPHLRVIGSPIVPPRPIIIETNAWRNAQLVYWPLG